MRLFIPGPPMAKGRARVMRTGITFTPKKTATAESTIQAIFAEGFSGMIPWDEPLFMELTATFPLPKSAPKALREKVERGERVWCPKKPDIDNIEKLVSDALNGLCYRDDSLICWVDKLKVYGKVPGIDIWVCPVTQIGKERSLEEPL